MDLDAYRSSAEAFVSELTGAYLPPLRRARTSASRSSRSTSATPTCSSARPVEELRELADAAPRGGEDRRRLTMLLDFAVEGYSGPGDQGARGRAGRREAAESIEVDGERIGFRESAVVQANEPDAVRREAIERARLELTEEQLNPLYIELVERQQECSRLLGYANYRELCRATKGIDLRGAREPDGGVRRGHRAHSTRTCSSPSCERTLGLGLDELRRSDLPRFFRVPDEDRHFPADRLLQSLLETLARPRHRRAGQRRARRRAAANKITARVLRPGPRPRRGVPGDRAGRRPRRLLGPVPRGRPHRALRPRRPASCRSSSATSATTRSPRRSRSCSSTWSRTRCGWSAGSASTTRAGWSPTPAPTGSSTCAATRPSSPTSSSCTAPGRLAASGMRSATRSCSALRSRVRVAGPDVPGRRRSGLLLRLLPARLGARDPPARAPARALRAGVVRVGRGGPGALRAVARGPAPDARGAAARAGRRRELDFGVLLDDLGLSTLVEQRRSIAASTDLRLAWRRS